MSPCAWVKEALGPMNDSMIGRTAVICVEGERGKVSGRDVTDISPTPFSALQHGVHTQREFGPQSVSNDWTSKQTDLRRIAQQDHLVDLDAIQDLGLQLP